jgi:hypothetical protein
MKLWKAGRLSTWKARGSCSSFMPNISQLHYDFNRFLCRFSLFMLGIIKPACFGGSYRHTAACAWNHGSTNLAVSTKPFCPLLYVIFIREIIQNGGSLQLAAHGQPVAVGAGWVARRAHQRQAGHRDGRAACQGERLGAEAQILVGIAHVRLVVHHADQRNRTAVVVDRQVAGAKVRNRSQQSCPAEHTSQRYAHPPARPGRGRRGS